MSKAVLISIQPEWCKLIVNGKKTVEVRKTRPKIDTPFKCYIYCTKGKAFWLFDERFETEEKGNGKVVGEFVCNKIHMLDVPYPAYRDQFNTELAQKALVDYWMCHRYSRSGATLYCWHISDLLIYDQPRELETFKKRERNCFYAHLGLAKRDCSDCRSPECMVHRPPQSWCYVEDTRQPADKGVYYGQSAIHQPVPADGEAIHRPAWHTESGSGSAAGHL